MRIAVNTRFLLKDQLEGFGWFTFEHFKRITRQHSEHEFIFLFDRPFDDQFIFGENVSGVVVNPPARHPYLWYWWFARSLPRTLNKIKPDLFVSTDGFLSLKAKVPTLLVIHDLAFEHYPEYVPNLARKFYRKNTPKYVKKANHIITVSEFTRQDVISRYGIDSSKITVIHNGASRQFEPLSEYEKKIIKDQYSKGQPYFLFVGALHPRKNISRLLTAYDLFKVETQSKYKLLIAGREMFGNEEMKRIWSTMKFKDDVIFTGHLNLADLAKVNAAASALVYVSIFEGFGIPIVEAMKCGIPVIASNTSAIPEVAGDAAIYTDPFSVNEISGAMKRLSENDSLHGELSKMALKRSKHFSWDKAANELWTAIEQMF